MKTIIKRISASIILAVMIITTVSLCAFAVESTSADTSASDAIVLEQESDSTGSKALAAGIAIGLAAAGGAIGMGMAIAKSSDGISRQPEAEGKIRTNLMLGLVFVETAIIYALIVAILIIFVL